MLASVATLTVLMLSPGLDLPTAAWQLAPKVEGELKTPKVTRPRAVLCLPGFYPHPIRPEKAQKPEIHEWFAADSALLKALAPDCDVYGFGYAQTTAIDAVASCNGLRRTVETLRTAGYREIILIGHSAGGLVAHQFVERYPDRGVTKIIPVAAPYGGSDLAEIDFGLPKTQVEYIKSLAPQPRLEVLKTAKPLPKTIEICCVTCKISRIPNDLMVGLSSQWPPEIRQQGIPAALVAVNHFDALKAEQGVAVVADLVKSKLVRWSDEDVAKATKIIFGKDADAAAAAAPKKDRPILRKTGELLDRLIGDRGTRP